MERNIKFRTLRANEIVCRPQGLGDKYPNLVKILLYIDSRAVTNFLDEAIGNLNWQMELGTAGGQMVGKLSIKNPENGEWVSKSDTGSESNIEAEKGLVSDIYKRCLSRWGVTELYTGPSIVFEKDKVDYEHLKVSKIEYNEQRRISALELKDKKGNVVYTWSVGNNAPAKPVANRSNIEQIYDYCCESAKTADETTKEDLKDFYDHYRQGKGREKIENWKGKLEPSKLFQNWINNKRQPSNYIQNGIMQIQPELAIQM